MTQAIIFCEKSTSLHVFSEFCASWMPRSFVIIIHYKSNFFWFLMIWLTSFVNCCILFKDSFINLRLIEIGICKFWCENFHCYSDSHVSRFLVVSSSDHTYNIHATYSLDSMSGCIWCLFLHLKCIMYHDKDITRETIKPPTIRNLIVSYQYTKKDNVRSDRII